MFGLKGKSKEQPLEITPRVESSVIETIEPPKRPQKYELLEAEYITDPNGRTYSLHRIKALIDIPLHNVKAGDVGGYVYNEKTLSHNGSCWVGGNALVIQYRDQDRAIVTEDALVTDEAFVTSRIKDKAKVSDNAIVHVEVGSSSQISDDCKLMSGYVMGPLIAKGNVKIQNAKIQVHYLSSVVLDGNITVNNDIKENPAFINSEAGGRIEIKGNTVLNNVYIRGNCHIDAEVNLENVSFKGENTILGKPQIKPDVKFTGKNFISGDSLIPPGTHVHDVKMSTGFLSYGVPVGSGMGIPEVPVAGSPEAVPVAPVGFSVSAAETQEYIELIGQIEAEYEEYTTDIVKLIKYPAMVDTSIPEVGEFVYNLRAAKRAVKGGNAEKIEAIAEVLERAFLNAENRVQMLVASHLDDSKKKSLKDAEKIFKLACDDASPEPEKRLGFKAGMRALEGIIVVSDKATENMKERIGILELEA